MRRRGWWLATGIVVGLALFRLAREPAEPAARGPSPDGSIPAAEPARSAPLAGDLRDLQGPAREALDPPTPVPSTESAGQPRTAGAAVVGIVLVDGRAPDEPLELLLGTTAGRLLGRARATTDATGAFRFEGASDGWSGLIALPDGYFDEAWAQQIVVEAAREDLVLRLRRPPAIIGRVVDGQRAPVADASVRVEQFCTTDAGATQGTGGSFHSDGGGRFRVPVLDCEGHLTVTLEASAFGVGRAVLPSEEVDPEVGRDVGDLVLLPDPSLLVVVHDEAGRPIEGAVVLIGGPEPVRSEPSGSDGHVRLASVWPGTPALTAAARGFVAATVPLADPPPPRVDVTLLRGGSLLIRVVAPDGSPVPGARVALCAADSPLDLPTGVVWPRWLPRPSDWSIHDDEGGGRTVTQTLLSDDEGRVALDDLRVGLELAVLVMDAQGQPAAPERRVAIGERPVEIVVTVGEARSLFGRVVDVAGLPVAGVQVVLLDRGPGAAGSYVQTDAAGGFRYEGIRVAVTTLVAHKPGYADTYIEDVAVPAGDDPIEVVLAPGREVLVRIIDEAGEEGAPSRVAAFRGERWLAGGQREPDGRFRLTDLPDGEVELVAWVGERSARVRHDTRVPHAEIVVP